MFMTTLVSIQIYVLFASLAIILRNLGVTGSPLPQRYGRYLDYAYDIPRPTFDTSLASDTYSAGQAGSYADESMNYPVADPDLGESEDNSKNYQQEELVFSPGNDDEMRVSPDGNVVYAVDIASPYYAAIAENSKPYQSNNGGGAGEYWYPAENGQLITAEVASANKPPAATAAAAEVSQNGTTGNETVKVADEQKSTSTQTPKQVDNRRIEFVPFDILDPKEDSLQAKRSGKSKEIGQVETTTTATTITATPTKTATPSKTAASTETVTLTKTAASTETVTLTKAAASTETVTLTKIAASTETVTLTKAAASTATVTPTKAPIIIPTKFEAKVVAERSLLPSNKNVTESSLTTGESEKNVTKVTVTILETTTGASSMSSAVNPIIDKRMTKQIIGPDTELLGNDASTPADKTNEKKVPASVALVTTVVEKSARKEGYEGEEKNAHATSVAAISNEPAAATADEFSIGVAVVGSSLNGQMKENTAPVSSTAESTTKNGLLGIQFVSAAKEEVSATSKSSSVEGNIRTPIKRSTDSDSESESVSTEHIDLAATASPIIVQKEYAAISSPSNILAPAISAQIKNVNVEKVSADDGVETAEGSANNKPGASTGQQSNEEDELELSGETPATEKNIFGTDKRFRRKRRDLPVNLVNQQRHKRSEITDGLLGMRQVLVDGRMAYFNNPESISYAAGNSGGVADQTGQRITRQTVEEFVSVPAPTASKFPPTFCELDMDNGNICPGIKRGIFLEQFYYDADSNRCIHFVYNGCGGNANRFSSLWECTQYCGKRQENVKRKRKVLDDQN